MAFPWLRRPRKRLFVLSIDGVPISLVREGMAAGRMPNLARLSQEGDLVQMRSVIPTISSVAWATFATGVNPGRHNIFGFVECDEGMRFTIPNSRDLKAPALWELLNQAGKRTIVLNVPVTYPPKPVNGLLVAGFLSPSLEKACYPTWLSHKLAALGYVVDPDPWKAREDKDGFFEDCFAALQARERAALELMRSEEWDFFMLHVMETDRVNHFYWDAYQGDGADDPRYHRRFWDFYTEVDRVIGQVHDALPQGTEFVVLSDHGFCGIRREVDLNAYLRERGWLKFKGEKNDPTDIHPESRAYSLIPGRVFINLNGRQPMGSVGPADYERVRDELTKVLLGLTDPETGEPVIERVYRREELYSGPYLERAADLIAHPHRGYDLKAKMGEAPLFGRSHRPGMHTYDDAMLYVKGHRLTPGRAASILDVTPTLFELMGLEVPHALEGRSLLTAGS